MPKPFLVLLDVLDIDLPVLLELLVVGIEVVETRGVLPEDQVLLFLSSFQLLLLM